MSLPEISAHAVEETPATSLRRAIPLAAVLVCGVLFSAVAALVVRDEERKRFEDDFDREAQVEWSAMRVAIREYEECLFTLRDLFGSSDEVNAREFRKTAADLRARHAGLELLAWVPRVKREERAAFESATRGNEGDPFFIHDYQVQATDAGAAPAPSPEREEYLPLRFCDPVSGNKKLFGVDHLRGPYGASIERAITTGKVAATQRVSFRGSAGDEPGWASVLPVYAGEDEPKTVDERRERLRGVLAGALPFSGLLANTIRKLPRGNVDLLLLDESGANGERFLASFVGGEMRVRGLESGDDFRAGLHRALAMPVAGRQWIALFRPTAVPAPMYPWAFLAGGIALTGLLMALLHSAQRRTRTVQSLVRERTAELHATQELLREDNERRRKAEERYRAFVEQSSEAIWRFELSEPFAVFLPEDEQAELYYTRAFLGEANDACAQMYGFERAKEMIGMGLADLMPHDHTTLAHLRDFVRSGYRLSDAESREIGRDGTQRIFLNNLTGIVENGLLVRVWGTQRDVTGQRAAEEEKAQIERRLWETQRLESLGILAGGVAHDFNNLLTGILGNTCLARMDIPATSPVQVNLEAIEKTSRRAAELCKQMLAYSGKGRFVVQRLDLSEIAEDTVQLVHPSISKNAVVDFQLARDLPAISADATQMRQIVMNLLLNASDALVDGAGTITLKTGVIEADSTDLAAATLSPNVAPGKFVFLEISDTGCGMSSETLSKIFNPFFTTKFTGRGLGLAAVLGIVRGHGGAIKVSSEQGRGSTFRLLLPAVDGKMESSADDALDEHDWQGSGKVLVADDDAAVRTVASRLLEKSGFTVVTAADGFEALELFRKTPDSFAAVLLDLTMPQMDGLAAFKEMRRIRAEIPVVLMSGYSEQDAISRFVGQGLAAFVQKPFTPAELRRAFRDLAKRDGALAV